MYKRQQVIVSADRAPNKLFRIQERIKSRFAGGLVVDIQNPDYDLRYKIVKAKIDELKLNQSISLELSEEIQKFIKKEGFELFYSAYVVDEYDHLIGTIGTTELLLAERNTLIENLMNPEVVAVDQDLDQEEVARIAKEYDLVVVPVIDKHLRLIGRVTLDDLVDVIVEEHNEDLGHIAGTGDEEAGGCNSCSSWI